MSTSFFSATGESTSCRSPCMDFLPPLGGVFRLSLTRSSPGIPCRRLCGFQGAVLNLAIKKSPHNNLNLTIPSGMALVRVCYVAIRKLKTCSGSFGSRAGTLSKYVILNCWDRLPQKSSHVNVNLSGGEAPPFCCARPFCRLKASLGLSLLCSAAQTRIFENTPLSAGCKKTQWKLWQKERAGDSFYLFVFYQQRLIGFQFYIRQPDGSALRGVILATQSIQICSRWVLGKVEQSH